MNFSFSAAAFFSGSLVLVFYEDTDGGLDQGRDGGLDQGRGFNLDSDAICSDPRSVNTGFGRRLDKQEQEGYKMD